MTVPSWIKKNASTILTWLGAGGAIVTVVLAVKATPKAMDKIQIAAIDKEKKILNGDLEGEDEKNNNNCKMSELTMIETVQVCWKEYVPTAAIGIGSLACIFGANVLSCRQQASLASAYTALASSFEAYRDKVEMLCGPSANIVVEKALEQEKRDLENDRPPWDEIQTFYLEGYPQFFERTMEQVLKAEYELNRYFILKGQATFNEFLAIMDLSPVDGGDAIGWDAYIGDVYYGYKWVDFEHRYYPTDDRMWVCAIDMPFDPHPLDETEKEMEVIHC